MNWWNLWWPRICFVLDLLISGVVMASLAGFGYIGGVIAGMFIGAAINEWGRQDAERDMRGIE